ncbi:DUF2939 domain-containing protein [Falsiroseomonas selenitidurans]|uniref:DUF2939 domain-containing protein n=1 Tax=Falsiroseomonas selenitidurans TaxID=2716335 RepID=A0ABX1E5F7_9PROT|nr:DUF2939 domain-containing protein [Falsiroseomonas selenitidurans]NKC31002.1 DUF2939 domain-containing protein [Falsiroseomonas selenitidurans]
MSWDDVWAEYDARRPTPSAALPARPPLTGEATAQAREGRARSPWPALALLPLLAMGWIGAPYATAWDLVQALEGRDGEALSRHLDLPALQSALRDSLRPHAAAGERTPEARAFLAGMAEEISTAWASPTALADVARARGVRPGAAAAALRHSAPTGLTRFEMPLAGSVAPMTLQLELNPTGLAPRWQVTAVRLDLADQRAAMPPPAATAPRARPAEQQPLRLSALR